MASISSLAAKTRFGQLLARVERGEEVVITKHDRPVARIVPIRDARGVSVQSAVDGLCALQAEIKARRAPKLTFAEFQSAVREGRR